MRCLIYQVYVGPRSRLYDFCVASVADYCAAHGFKHIVQTVPFLKIKPNPETSGRSEGASRLGYLPIFEKENALDYLGEFDQVAVIDADVWARPGAPSIFDELPAEFDFGAVREREMPLTEKYLRKIRSYSEGLFRPLDDVDWQWNDKGAEFQNMGVMVMNWTLVHHLNGEDPAEFLARPEFQRFVDGVGKWKWSTDQVLLNWWIKKEGITSKPLHWRWNCFYGSTVPGSAERAWFVHFFLRDHLPEKGENIEELVKSL